jgi:hypothetical protein
LKKPTLPTLSIVILVTKLLIPPFSSVRKTIFPPIAVSVKFSSAVKSMAAEVLLDKNWLAPYPVALIESRASPDWIASGAAFVPRAARPTRRL